MTRVNARRLYALPILLLAMNALLVPAANAASYDSGETVEETAAINITGDELYISDGTNVTFTNTVTVNAGPTPSTDPTDGRMLIGSYDRTKKKPTARFKETVTVAHNNIDVVNATADFEKATSAKAIEINADSKTKFHSALTVAGSLEIMNLWETSANTASVNEFAGDVTAGVLGIYAAGGSTNTFGGAVKLTGYEEDFYKDTAMKVALLIGGGTNSFEKNVDTSGRDAVFAKSTSTFSAMLNAGGGDVHIGYSDFMKRAEETAADNTVVPVGFYNAPVAVVLSGNAAEIKAKNVTLHQNGTLAVRGNGTVTGNLNFKDGSTFAIDAANKLTVSGTTTVEKGAAANIQGASGAASIGNVVLTSNGGITGSDFAAAGASLYTVGREGKDLKITGLNSVKDVIGGNGPGSGNSGAGGNMADDILGGNAAAEGELKTKLSNVMNQIGALAASDPDRARIAAAQAFGEHALAGLSAARATSQAYAGSTANRQISLRDSRQAAAGVRSGAAYAAPRYAGRSYSNNSAFDPNRVWAAGFGAFTRQGDKDGAFGYKYNSGGFILGYDREAGDFVFGVSAAYSAGRVKNNEGFTSTDVDTMNVGLYASYNHPTGFFVDANAGLGMAWNDTATMDVISGGLRTGSYRNTSFQLGTTVGYAFALPAEARIIPSLGLQWTNVHQQGWSESVSVQSPTQLANWFDRSNDDYLSLPLQVRANKTFRLGGEASITPELRAAWVYEAVDPRTKVRMGYVGSSASTTIAGMSAGRSRGILGAGVKAKMNSRVDAFVDYNFEFRSRYQNHNVMAGLGVAF